MKLIVNRKEMEFKEGIKLHEVLEAVQLTKRAMGAAVNGTVVNVCSIEGYALKEGDKIDILPALAAG
jgi:thiamine biosynthesis protein ThiS